MMQRVAVAGLVLGSLLGCEGDPVQTTLGCPPPRVASAIVCGTVVDTIGQAVSAADVVISGIADAGTPTDTIGNCAGVFLGGGSTLTDESGRYREKIRSIFVGKVCVAVAVEAAGLSGFVSGDSVELRGDLGEICTPESTFDSARVDVVVRG